MQPTKIDPLEQETQMTDSSADISDYEIGEALEVLARDLSNRFPINTEDVYEGLVQLYQAIEIAIETSRTSGMDVRLALAKFTAGALAAPPKHLK